MLTIAHFLLVLPIAAIFLTLRSIYRLYFHPLRSIPGPKLTAITHLYEFYYDIIKGGKFFLQIEKMHREYGPVVRINPREVHISDPRYYDEIYATGSRKRDKDPGFVSAYATPSSMISTIGHDHHRFRREILNGFFSKGSVMKLAPTVEGLVQQLMKRFEEAHRENTTLRLDDAFAALTSDVITHYCYGKSWGFLEDKNFRSDLRGVINEITALFHINRFVPWLAGLLRMIPERVMCLLQPGKAGIYVIQNGVFAHSAESLQDKSPADTKKARTIFDKLTDHNIPPEERSLPRLHDEGLVIFSAGTETTARVLTVGAFYLANDREIWNRLRTELKQVLPTSTSTASWTQLEKLPYLSGVINESLRLSYGLIVRLPRVAPTEALKFNEHIIPPGTPMSSSSYIVHRDPTVFPNPEKFDPERWIRAEQEGAYLTRYIASFTRGTRSCLGMNLAYMEIYMTIAYMVRRFDMKLYDTTFEDIRVNRDMGIGFTERGDLRVYANVTGVVD